MRLYKRPTDIFFLNRYPYFQIFFTDLWPVANILLTTETDIPKFAYRYICRYFNKVFWLKLVGIASTSLVHFGSKINQYKCVYVIAKIAKQCCCIGKT